MTRVAVFPGQGSQAVGMADALIDATPAAKAVFDAVDAALGEPLSALIADGPAETLTLTHNAQPALMATSLAAVRALEAQSGKSFADLFDFAAGHSLGEYSALAAAGVIPIATAAKLLRLRGEAMQRAVPVGAGAMAAVLGPSVEAVQDLIDGTDRDLGVCAIANDNAPGQVVISGSAARVEAVIVAAKAAGVKRCVPLPVSAPFHCALMAPAAEEMRDALADVPFAAPSVPIVQNVAVAPITDPETLKANLITQVTGRVRWTETQSWFVDQGLAGGYVELGAGKVLAGLMKRVDRSVVASSLGDAEGIRAFAAAIK